MTVSADIQTIAGVLHDYQEALNGGSTEDAVSLYAQDGVCMPPHAQASVGIENIRNAYDEFFSTTKFNVRFDIKEIVPVAPDWAFARTSSTGTADVKGRGVGNEANQELFVFQKTTGGEWKIARYCFSTTNPLQ